MPQSRTTLVVRSGREPFEVAFLISCLAVGVALLVTPDFPASVSVTMPLLLQHLWTGGLIATGLLGGLGLALQGKQLVRGLLVELAGLSIGCAAELMYGVALFTVSGGKAAAAGGFVLAFACGAAARLYRILTDLRAAPGDSTRIETDHG